MTREMLDSEFSEQAEILADNVGITPRQAEAYLRWYLAHDDTTDSTLAQRMGINRSSFSELLSKAQSEIEDDQKNTLNPLIKLVTTGAFSPANGVTSCVLETRVSRSSAVILLEDMLDEGTAGPRYHLYFVYRGMIIPEDDADAVGMANSWNTVEISGDNKTQIVNGAEHYLDRIDNVGLSDKVPVYAALREAGFDVTEEMAALADEF